jgi:hypothetical protein
MTTPKKTKRFSAVIPADKKGDDQPSGNYSGGIHNTEIAVRLANIVANFVHLEERMSFVLAILLGASHEEPAKYVLRSIKSPKARIDVMKALLTEAPSNVQRDSSYDEIIDEFADINNLRNGFVHGIWWTHESGRVFLSRFLDDFQGMVAREVKPHEMDQLLARMHALTQKILRHPFRELVDKQNVGASIKYNFP